MVKLKRGFVTKESLPFIMWHGFVEDMRNVEGSKHAFFVLYPYPEQEIGSLIRGLLSVELRWDEGKLLPRISRMYSDCRADAFDLGV